MSQQVLHRCHRPVSSNQWLRPVRAALDAATAPVDVFFRDDDAGWGDGRLIELIDLFSGRGLPLDVAVIPAALEPALAAELRTRVACSGGLLRLHQHGYSHVNHEVTGRKYEFGPSRTGEEQRRDIVAGRERLAELLGGEVDPIFTPPWNRCTADTVRCLAALGFVALSREARAEPLGVAGLPELPVRVDWVRLSVAELADRLAGAFACGGPAGVMFHHAVMEGGDMRRAGDLLSLVADHPRARPAGMAALVG
jgi:hypothetical protein